MPTNKELTERIRRQKKDNATLIDKIEVLNNDVKSYERTAKTLISENAELRKGKGYRTRVIDELNKELGKYKHYTVGLSIIVVALTIYIFFYGGFTKRLIHQQEEQLSICKDSIKLAYMDTLFTCRDLVDKQTRALIGSQSRFNFAIEYYTASFKERASMEEDMCGILIKEGKKPDKYLRSRYNETDVY